LLSVIRSVTRLFICSPTNHCRDISDWQVIGQLYTHYDAVTRTASDTLPLNVYHQKQWDTLQEQVAQYTLMVDVDFVMIVVAEILLRRMNSLEMQLRSFFETQSRRILGDMSPTKQR
jgi:hypothetical protein